jgi:hypothetical protein
MVAIPRITRQKKTTTTYRSGNSSFLTPNRGFISLYLVFNKKGQCKISWMNGTPEDNRKGEQSTIG